MPLETTRVDLNLIYEEARGAPREDTKQAPDIMTARDRILHKFEQFIQ